MAIEVGEVQRTERDRREGSADAGVVQHNV
jgi:hypothetical protein